MISEKEIYAADVQLVIHAEQITWNRFYNFLTANSILVLAWATIYSANEPKYYKWILSSISIIGTLSGILWAGLSHRGSKYLDTYLKIGQKIENDPGWPTALSYKLFSLTSETAKELRCFNWASSKPILIGGSVSFTVLHIFLLLMALIR